MCLGANGVAKYQDSKCECPQWGLGINGYVGADLKGALRNPIRGVPKGGKSLGSFTKNIASWHRCFGLPGFLLTIVKPLCCDSEEPTPSPSKEPTKTPTTGVPTTPGTSFFGKVFILQKFCETSLNV